MRHLGILLLGSISIAACASNENAPPPASSDTVAQATVQPNDGPNFAPAASDGLATASGDTRGVNSAAHPATTAGSKASGATTTSGSSGTGTGSASATNGAWANGSNGTNGVGATATTGNAAAAPADTSAQPTGPSADNSRVNKRDKGDTLTPMDQGSSEADRKMTQQIRQEVMKDKSLSFTAKNVKIITINGKVTLRGPVKTEAERTAIESAARRVAGSGAAVDSQLELAK